MKEATYLVDNDLAVERFEQFVLQQKPGAKWTPVTPYDVESRRKAEGKHPELILETFNPGSILDYGCGFGHLLAFLKEQQPSRAHLFTGYDPYGPVPQWRDLPANRFELVICREVLEHCTVKDVAKVVRQLVARSSRYLYITTRFAKNPDHFLSVETEFDVDPTHITCVTKPFLRMLFILEGCKSRPDLEAKLDWQQKGRCLVFEVA